MTHASLPEPRTAFGVMVLLDSTVTPKALVSIPDHLLSTPECALDREPYLHYELAEGVLVLTPRPRPQHQDAAMQVAQLLKS